MMRAGSAVRRSFTRSTGGGGGLALDLNLMTGTLPSIVTFSRASSVTDSFYTDAAGSSFNSYSSGVARMLATGYLPEESRIQQLLNSAVPVTQTTASLATGTYVFWCIGTGSVTSSAGTATATGLGAITGSQGTFQTIAVTVAGTLTFTVSGSINRFQLELGAVPTSFISSAGATATRAADVATVALSSTSIPASPTALTIIGKARTNLATPTANTFLFAVSDGTASNRIGFYRPGTLMELHGLNVASGVSTDTTLASASNGSAFSFWMSFAPGSFRGQIIGSSIVTASPAAIPAGLTTLTIGLNQAQIQQWGAPIARLQIYTSRLSDAQAAAIATAL